MRQQFPLHTFAHTLTHISASVLILFPNFRQTLGILFEYPTPTGRCQAVQHTYIHTLTHEHEHMWWQAKRLMHVAAGAGAAAVQRKTVMASVSCYSISLISPERDTLWHMSQSAAVAVAVVQVVAVVVVVVTANRSAVRIFIRV